MEKRRKAGTSRKPPEPSETHAEIEDWIRRVMPDLHPIVERLDKTIRDTIPGLQYAVKWRKAYYGLPEQGWIIELVAYDVSVNVVFFGGADFDSPPPLGDSDRSLEPDYQALSGQLGRRFTVDDIPRGDPIGDPDALLVLGGRDLDENACRMIDEYVMRGGRVLFCIDGVDIDMRQNLAPSPAGERPVFDLLETYGVRIRRELVYDESCRDFRLPIVIHILPHGRSVDGSGFSHFEYDVHRVFPGLDFLRPGYCHGFLNGSSA